ncbi:MAG: hypothetical protein HY556_10515 [Euryarchaeota archaeon]|nr:hypothetical protein [Euryarchaeota archaeon]
MLNDTDEGGSHTATQGVVPTAWCSQQLPVYCEVVNYGHHTANACVAPDIAGSPVPFLVGADGNADGLIFDQYPDWLVDVIWTNTPGGPFGSNCYDGSAGTDAGYSGIPIRKGSHWGVQLGVWVFIGAGVEIEWEGDPARFAECDDGLDNDFDPMYDFPADSDCRTYWDDSEEVGLDTLWLETREGVHAENEGAGITTGHICSDPSSPYTVAGCA